MIDGVSVRWVPIGVSPFQAAAVIGGEDADELLLQVESGLLEGEKVEEFCERFRIILESLASTDSVTSTVGSIPRFSPRQASRIEAFEQGGLIESGTIPSTFKSMADLTPDAVAVIGHERTLTYRELNEWSASVGAALRELGIKPGERVAIPGERGIEAIVAKAGITEYHCKIVASRHCESIFRKAGVKTTMSSYFLIIFRIVFDLYRIIF